MFTIICGRERLGLTYTSLHAAKAAARDLIRAGLDGVRIALIRGR